MAVSIADIAAGSTTASSVTTITTPAFVTTSNANRAGLLGLSVDVNSISAISGSIGGVSGAAISSTDSGTAQTFIRSLQFGVIAPPSGSQTATMSWTTAADAVLGAVTTSGVDQTTPFNNGTFSSATSGGTSSVAITSASGDLTCDTVADDQGGGLVPGSPNQTSLWSRKVNAAVDGAGSRGPGTGSVTHSWSLNVSVTQWTASGANFKQVVGGGPVVFPRRDIVKLQAVNRSRL